MNAPTIEALAELLKDYAVFTGKPLYLTWRPADGWELLHKYAFRIFAAELGAQFVAVRDDKNAQYWIVTDYARMNELLATSKELPTAAPELVMHFARTLGTEPDRWELSDGWAASVKRLADRPAAFPVPPLPGRRFQLPN